MEWKKLNGSLISHHSATTKFPYYICVLPQELRLEWLGYSILSSEQPLNGDLPKGASKPFEQVKFGPTHPWSKAITLLNVLAFWNTCTLLLPGVITQYLPGVSIAHSNVSMVQVLSKHSQQFLCTSVATRTKFTQVSLGIGCLVAGIVTEKDSPSPLSGAESPSG